MSFFLRQRWAFWFAGLLASGLARRASVGQRGGPASCRCRRRSSILAMSSPTICWWRAPSSRTPSRAATVYEAREALVGKVARRTLLPGQPIPISAIRDPYLVIAGQDGDGRFRARRPHHHDERAGIAERRRSATS